MEEKSTFWKSAMIYGLYIGIVLTLYSVIFYVTGLYLNEKLGYVVLLVYIACIVFTQIHYRNRELNGFISYGQAVGFAVAAMLFGGIIHGLYSIIISNIDPGMIEQIKTIQEDAMLQKGMSEDQIEAAMSIMSKMMTPGWMSMIVLLSAVFYGTIVSLISSIFIKRQAGDDAFEEAMEEVKTEE